MKGDYYGCCGLYYQQVFSKTLILGEVYYDCGNTCTIFSGYNPDTIPIDTYACSPDPCSDFTRSDCQDNEVWWVLLGALVLFLTCFFMIVCCKKQRITVDRNNSASSIVEGEVANQELLL